MITERDLTRARDECAVQTRRAGEVADALRGDQRGELGELVRRIGDEALAAEVGQLAREAAGLWWRLRRLTQRLMEVRPDDR